MLSISYSFIAMIISMIDMIHTVLDEISLYVLTYTMLRYSLFQLNEFTITNKLEKIMPRS